MAGDFFNNNGELSTKEVLQSIYRFNLKSWQMTVSQRNFTSNPFCLLENEVPPPPMFTPEVENVLDERAQCAAFFCCVSSMDQGLYDKLQRILLSPVTLSDGSVSFSNVEFLCRTVWLTTLYCTGEKTFSRKWTERFKQYLTVSWPEYRGRRITAALLDEWMIWNMKNEIKNSGRDSIVGMVDGFMRGIKALFSELTNKDKNK